MTALLDFEEYIKIGVVTKQSPNLPRANFLIEESNKSFLGLKQRIEKIGINELNASSIVKDSHDVILELIRANMLILGFNASGVDAHKAEVAYMSKLGFFKPEIEFVDEIRYLRNGILYYGTKLDKDYAEKVVNFLFSIYPKLKKSLK